MKSNNNINTSDMYAPDIIFDHFDKLYHELGQEKDLWKDCEDYFFSFLKRKIYLKAWENMQLTCTPAFRNYVNSTLGQNMTVMGKDKAA